MRVGMPLEYIGFHLCVCFFPWYILSGIRIQTLDISISNTKKEAIDIELKDLKPQNSHTCPCLNFEVSQILNSNNNRMDVYHHKCIYSCYRHTQVHT